MAKINLTGVLNDAALNSIKELVGEEAYGKLVGYEFESGEQKLIPQAKFNEQAQQLKVATETNTALSKQIEELGKFKGTAEEKDAEIKKLTEAQAKAQEDFKKQMLDYKTSVAWDKALAGTKAKNSNALKGMIDLSKVSYDETKDALVGFDEQVAQIQKDNAWLFESQVPGSGGYKGTSGKTPPAEGEFDAFRNA